MTTAANTRSVHTGMPRSGTRFSGAGLVKYLELERDYLNEQDRRGICSRVKEARVEAGLTEREIADMLSPPVTDRAIRNYESTRPPFRYLRQWAEITATTYDWLLRGVEQEPVVLAPAMATGLRQSLEALEARMDRMGDAAMDAATSVDERLERLEALLELVVNRLAPPTEEANPGQE